MLIGAVSDNSPHTALVISIEEVGDDPEEVRLQSYVVVNECDQIAGRRLDPGIAWTAVPPRDGDNDRETKSDGAFQATTSAV